MEIIGETFDEIYFELMLTLSDYPQYVCSPRGQKIKEMLCTTLVLHDPRARVLVNPAREANYGFAVGEFLWYWQGKNDLETMVYYNKRMGSFSNDGKTLNSAYGMRLRGIKKGRGSNPLSQWDVVIGTLLNDPDSRRAVMIINQPIDEHEALVDGSKDVPCTLSLQFFVRDNKLHLHTLMRSCDAIWGLTYDLFSFTLFQECMLNELRVHEKFKDLELGSYYHTAGSVHLYERHFDLAEKIINTYEFDEHFNLMEPFDMNSLNDLCDQEQLLRLKYINKIDTNFSPETINWMAERLNEHRSKRDAEARA